MAPADPCRILLSVLPLPVSRRHESPSCVGAALASSTQSQEGRWSMGRVSTVLFFVLSIAAASAAQDGVSDAGQTGLAPEPRAVTRAIDWADRVVNQTGKPRNGLYPELGNMITGAGWIS